MIAQIRGPARFPRVDIRIMAGIKIMAGIRTMAEKLCSSQFERGNVDPRAGMPRNPPSGEDFEGQNRNNSGK